MYETDEDQILTDSSADLEREQRGDGDLLDPEVDRAMNPAHRHVTQTELLRSVSSDEVEDDADVVLPALSAQSSAQSSPRDPSYDDTPDDQVLSLDAQPTLPSNVTAPMTVPVAIAISSDGRPPITRSVSGDDEIIMDSIFPPPESIEHLHVLTTVPIPVPALPVTIVVPHHDATSNGDDEALDYTSDSDDEILSNTPNPSPKKRLLIAHPDAHLDTVSNESGSATSSSSVSMSSSRPPRPQHTLPTHYELKLDLAIPTLQLKRSFLFDYTEGADTPEALGAQLMEHLNIGTEYLGTVIDQLTVCRQERRNKLLSDASAADASGHAGDDDYVIPGEEDSHQATSDSSQVGTRTPRFLHVRCRLVISSLMSRSELPLNIIHLRLGPRCLVEPPHRANFSVPELPKTCRLLLLQVAA